LFKLLVGAPKKKTEKRRRKKKKTKKRKEKTGTEGAAGRLCQEGPFGVWDSGVSRLPWEKGKYRGEVGRKIRALERGEKVGDKRLSRLFLS